MKVWVLAFASLAAFGCKKDAPPKAAQPTEPAPVQVDESPKAAEDVGAGDLTPEKLEPFLKKMNAGDDPSLAVSSEGDRAWVAVALVSGKFPKRTFVFKLLEVVSDKGALRVAKEVLIETHKGWKPTLGGGVFGAFTARGARDLLLLRTTENPPQDPRTDDDPDPCEPHEIVYELELFSADGKKKSTHRVGEDQHGCDQYEGHGMGLDTVLPLGKTGFDAFLLSSTTDGNHSWTQEIQFWQMISGKPVEISESILIEDVETNVDEGDYVVGETRYEYRKGRFVAVKPAE